ncbi:MAG: B12-binding domain-containing radical SAM protein [Chitinispirillaceae bacterium]|nr:B12-binding domain-containing radical SAM protein [Chitinispirillaceae bacterium]
MKIVFITPAADIRKTFGNRIGNRIYTRPNAITGPLILATMLRDRGHRVTVYEELYAQVDLRQLIHADVVGISTMTSTAPRAFAIADFFRSRGIRVVIGGMHASVAPEETSAHCDTVVAGEAENVIVDVMEGRRRDAIVQAPPVMDLDTVVFPDYSLLKTPCTEANIMTTRGCHFNCGFCSTSRMFHPYRERSAGSVIEELVYYKKRGFRYVNFQDDNFTGNRKRAKEILTAMIDRKLIFRDVFFFGRADIVLDEELLSLLSRAHLRSVLIGLESLNPAAIEYVKKKIHLQPLLDFMPRLGRYKIKLLASLVLGLDTDTREHIRTAVHFCSAINAFSLQPAVLTPFPGTPVFQQYQQEGRMVVKNWQYYDLMHATFQPKNMNIRELQNEFYTALRRFYSFRKSFTIMRMHGLAAGMRRLGLWFLFLFLPLLKKTVDKKYFAMLEQR